MNETREQAPEVVTNPGRVLRIPWRRGMEDALYFNDDDHALGPFNGVCVYDAVTGMDLWTMDWRMDRLHPRESVCIEGFVRMAPGGSWVEFIERWKK